MIKKCMVYYGKYNDMTSSLTIDVCEYADGTVNVVWSICLDNEPVRYCEEFDLTEAQASEELRYAMEEAEFYGITERELAHGIKRPSSF